MVTLRRAVENVAAASSQVPELLRGAVALLGRSVPVDGWCGLTLDPATLLNTGGVHESGLPDSVLPRLLEIEYRERDYVRFADLASWPRPVASLRDATGGRPELSPSYRDVLAPAGYADELRLVLVDRGQAWGAFTFLRTTDSPPFGAADQAVAAAMGGPLALGLRRVLLRAEVAAGRSPDHSGLILYDGRYDVVSVTPSARHWLAEEDDGRVAAAVAVAVKASVAEPATSRVWSATGGWTTLYGWRLGPDQVAVSIEPARPEQLTALVLDAYGLSAREREIARLVLLGRSTAQIAARLYLSPYTVQDHLKSVFDKTGVRSRRALAAELFFRHYLPDISDR